jgi:hypothetical protein
MRYEILRQVTPRTQRPFRIIETLDTKDGPRSRVCNGTWATLDEAKAEVSASAPDLLAALKEVLRVLVTPRGLPDRGKGRTDEQQATLDAARAAIAKATGAA